MIHVLSAMRQTPLLQRLAAVKVVAQLWSQPDIITQIATSFYGLPHDETIEYTNQWLEIEDRVRIKTLKLLEFAPCKRELTSDIIKPIGIEIIHWCRYHNLDSYPFNFLDKLLPLQFCWSVHGTVDYAKTAELIVKDERLDVVRRFEVACLNCLEDEARELFQFLPHHQIHKYISDAVGYEGMDHRVLVAYFTCVLSGDEDLLHRLFHVMDLAGLTVPINQYLFIVVLHRGSRATCEYFLQKVSRDESDQVFEWWERLAEYRDQVHPTCSLMFYLSRMNDEQREGLFRWCARCVLAWLLQWPMQSLFMAVALRGWQFMDSDDCTVMLDEVVIKINLYKDYDYAQLFWELWRLTSAEHKQHFFNNIDYLEDLIATKETEFIGLCLMEAPSQQLRQVVEDIDVYGEKIFRVLTDESVISDAALKACKQTAAENSSKDEDNEEKLLRSECVSRLVDLAMERRNQLRNR